MDTIKTIDTRREAILCELRDIRALRKGTINEQFLKVRHKGRMEPVLRGPYFVLSRRRGNKTVSERITTPEALAAAREEIAAHKHFVALCTEYEVLTERLGELERQTHDPLEKKQSR